MPRTIRIDDEVRAFLARRRRHRGESSNEVLRRWLSLDPDPDPGYTRRGSTGPVPTVTQRAVLDVLASTGTAMTAAQITAAARISPAATGKALRHLEQAGNVHRRHVSGDATRRWHDEWRINDTDGDPEQA
ncbi:MarR family transcriptional regulator [Spirillospora sp. CA-108201]